MTRRLQWSDEKKANVRKLYADGMSVRRISEALKCSNTAILTLCRDIKRDVPHFKRSHYVATMKKVLGPDKDCSVDDL